MRTLSMAVVGLVAFVVEALAQSGGRPAIEHLAFEVEGHGEMTYGISLPAGDDRTRVLVTGFSLGGRGTWFFATGHPELFTGAISIAGSPANEPLDALGDMPIAIIHSRADEVVPFGPAEAAAQALEAAKHPVRFTVLEGVGHFAMGGYVSALRDAGDWIVEQWDGRKLGSAD